MGRQPKEFQPKGSKPREPMSLGLKPRDISLYESLGIEFFEALFMNWMHFKNFILINLNLNYHDNLIK